MFAAELFAALACTAQSAVFRAPGSLKLVGSLIVEAPLS
jgi:hypothetical protein